MSSNETTTVKMCSMEVDENGRSYTGIREIKLHKVNDMESISEKQDAIYWGLAFNQNTGLGNEYEMHLTNQARIVAVMSGHAEITQQDGGINRMATGDFIFTHGKALHHANFRSNVPTQTLNVTFPSTADHKFK